MVKDIVTFFDKLEDRVRAHLSRYPILYSFIGAIGIVLVWKGVWEMAEDVPYLHGAASLALGSLILLMTGLMVSFFIGDTIIISGFKREKKLVEKTESEIKDETDTLSEISQELHEIEHDLNTIETKVENKCEPQDK